MKWICCRVAWVTLLFGYGSYIFAGSHYRNGTNLTAMVHVAATLSAMKDNGSGNSTLLPPVTFSKQQTAAVKSFVQRGMNETHPTAQNVSVPLNKGRGSPRESHGQKAASNRPGNERKSASPPKVMADALSANETSGASGSRHVRSVSVYEKAAHGARPNSRSARQGAGSVQVVEDAGRSFISSKISESTPQVLANAERVRVRRGVTEQPSIPVGNNNFTELVGQSSDGRFHLVEPVHLNGSHTPMHNQSVPFTGKLDNRGYPIHGLESHQNGPAGLFGAVQDSEIDVDLPGHNVTGNPAGAVAAELGSGNKVKLKGDGTVACTENTLNCEVGGIGGKINGSNNDVEQVDSVESVQAIHKGNERFGFIPQNVFTVNSQKASLSFGSIEGDNNTVYQKNVTGTVETRANTRTNRGQEDAVGTVGIASAAPASIKGQDNKVIQEGVEVNATSDLMAETRKINSGRSIGGKSLSSAGPGIVDGDGFELEQKDVKAHLDAKVNGDTYVVEQDYQPGDRPLHESQRDPNSFAQGVEAVASLGIGETNGTLPGITQIDVEAAAPPVAEASGAALNRYDDFRGEPGRTPAKATKAAAIGILKAPPASPDFQDTGYLGLFSGNAGQDISILGRTELKNSGGYGSQYFSPAIVDRSGYQAGENIGEVVSDTERPFLYNANTTSPQDWLFAWGSLNQGVDCSNNGSTHYVHESLPSLINLPDGNLAMVSRQRYPHSPDQDDNGIFRITRFDRNNGTLGGLPQVNETRGYASTGLSAVYQAQPGSNLSLPISQAANSTHIHHLYTNGNGSVQIASFPNPENLNRYSNPSYHTANFDIPGRPLFLGDEGSSLWTQEGNSTIKNYKYDGVKQLNQTQSYDLYQSSFAGRPVLATGQNSEWLYLARIASENQTTLERFNIEGGWLDPDFTATLNVPTGGMNYELSVSENNTVIILPKGTVHLAMEMDGGSGTVSGIDGDGVETTAIKAELPEFGGCINWKKISAVSITASSPVTVTAVVPESSSLLHPTTSFPGNVASTAQGELTATAGESFVSTQTLSPSKTSSVETSLHHLASTEAGISSFPMETPDATPEAMLDIGSGVEIGSGLNSSSAGGPSPSQTSPMETPLQQVASTVAGTSSFPMETPEATPDFQSGSGNDSGYNSESERASTPPGKNLTPTASQTVSTQAIPSKSSQLMTVDEMTTLMSSLSVQSTGVRKKASSIASAAIPSVTPMPTSDMERDPDSDARVLQEIVVPVVGGTVVVTIVVTATGAVSCIVTKHIKAKKKGKKKGKSGDLEGGEFAVENPTFVAESTNTEGKEEVTNIGKQDKRISKHQLNKNKKQQRKRKLKHGKPEGKMKGVVGSDSRDRGSDGEAGYENPGFHQTEINAGYTESNF